MASAHLSFGEAYLSLTRYPLAIEHDAAARDCARRADWAEGESSALGNLGVALREAGDLRRAADCYAAALEINVRIGSTRKQVLDMMNLGVVHAALGRLASARGLFERATALSGEAGSPSLTGMLAQCLGITRRYLGELADAEHELTAALAVFREINDVWAQASALESLAGMHADAGRRGQARHAAEEALGLARDIGSRRVEAAALNTLGLVQPDPAGALACHGEALAVAVAAGHVAARIEALVGQAGAQVRLGAHAEAERAAGEALDARPRQ